MAQPRTDASIENRTRELRKIADRLLELADEVELIERNKQQVHWRRALKGVRQIKCSRVASSLLMDTLAFDGPEDEQLRLIVYSWKEKPSARLRCFQHVCHTWKPLLKSGTTQSMSNMLDRAQALRILATGIVSSEHKQNA